MKLFPLISRNCAWCQMLLAVAALILSPGAEAGVPEVVAANDVAASNTVAPAQPPAFEIIPEDPLAARLRFSDKTIHYEKKVYLRNSILSGQWWMDESRYVAAQQDSYSARYQNGEDQPKIVIVDVRTGKIEDTGLVGKIRCYAEGRIATENDRLSTNPDGRVVRDAVSYFGELGKPLQEYRPGFPYDMELNIPSCQLVPRWKNPKPQSGELELVARFPLKVEHGVIFLWKPKNYPELRLGQDPNNYNRLMFNRVGATAIPPLLAYWEQPSGKRVEIPLNPGERIEFVSFVPFENAYFISIDLTNTQPIETWTPRFNRLLYLDGTIKRFGVPRVILDLVKANKAVARAGYSKNGISWGVGFYSFTPDPQHLAGSYEIVGDQLMKQAISGSRGFDGCKEFGSERSFFSNKWDYYYIDICKEDKK